MPRDTILSLLAEGRQTLQRAGVDSASLDARILLRETLGCYDADLIGKSEQTVLIADAEAYRAALARRARREPVSKILGWKEFYARRFRVTHDVLDPRPDTETLIELCLDHWPDTSTASFADMGCGSGAIGITLACERTKAMGLCCDVSEAAVAITRHNAASHRVTDRLAVVTSNWFASVTGTFDLIVSNPPYIPTAERNALQRDVLDYDPHIALFGGDDGLACYRILARGAESHLRTGGKLALEIGFRQENKVRATLEGHGLRLVDARHDLSGNMRALMFELASPVKAYQKNVGNRSQLG
jgi:release factor glutamine methyltransferase